MPKKPAPYLKPAMESAELQAGLKKMAERITKTLIFGTPSTSKTFTGFASSSGVRIHGVFTPAPGWGSTDYPFGTVLRSTDSDDHIMVIETSGGASIKAIYMDDGEVMMVGNYGWEEVPIEKP